MRNKVVLIKGMANVAPQITLAAFERINADHVVLIAALRRPQYLPDRRTINKDDKFPEGFEMDPTTLLMQAKLLLEHWHSHDCEHIVTSEYADMLCQQEDVRVVEGVSLEVPWFYETIKAFHKNRQQKVVEAQIVMSLDDGMRLVVDGQDMSLPEAIERLRPSPDLG